MAKSHKIGSDYFDYTEFPNTSNNIIVEIYEYGHYSIDFCCDISHMVVDYSYDCTSDDNIHQTASITLHVETDNQQWFMRRENKMREWIDEANGYTIRSTTWLNIIYHLVKTYTNDDTGEISKIDLGFFTPTSNDYNYNPTDGTVTISLSGLSALLTKEHGGGVVTVTNSVTTIDPKTHEKVTMTLPMALSVSQGVSIDNKLIFKLAMGSASQDYSYLDYTTPIPLRWGYIGDGQKVWNMPYDLDFDVDVGRSDILQKVMDLAFEGATFWVDENRVLQMSSKPTHRGSVALFWSDYGKLFLSESSSYDDSNYYNITEVYGKDNNCFARCDWSHLDGGLTHYARKQIISDDNLQTNEECEARAKWETYKSRYHHQTWTVTIADRYIRKFNKPSNIVGKCVEYTTVDGDTNLFFLNKLSYSGNKWTMELSLFRPLYETDMKQYDVQLHTPEIYKYEIIDGKYIRVYVTGEDIENAIVKLYVTDPYELSNSADGFRVESCLVADNGVDKYADIEIKGNGIYRIDAALYSPFYLDSGKTVQFYEVNVNLPVPVRPDNNPYPFPVFDEGGHEPYLLDGNMRVLTDENGNALTI